MRAPKRHRPPSAGMGAPVGVDLSAVAEKAEYVGSPEHKDLPSFAGQPRPRADASICDRRFVTMLDEIRRWLRTGIQKGAVSALWEGDFPRKVWYKDGDTVYEGRLVNRELGTYKGYPLNPDEWPPGIKDIYGE